MFKKITLTITAIFFIALLGFAITLPIAIKTTLNNIENLLQFTTLTPEKIEIPASVETLEIDFDSNYYYFTDIVIKQSPDNTAYLELFGAGENTYGSNSKISVSYPDEKTAKIYTERAFGTYQFNKNTIDKTIVKKLQNYPDAVLYIPATMNIKINNIEDIHYFENVLFKNKQELSAQLETKNDEERIQQEAERLLEQRKLEEERIQQEAERLLEQHKLEEERIQQQTNAYAN